MVFLRKLGIALVVAFGMGLLWLAIGNLLATDRFIQWDALGRPPGQIAKIVGSTIYSVTVETTSNDIYAFDTSSKESSWQITSDVLIDETPDSFQCISSKLTDDIIDISESCFLTPGGETESIYVLKKDGNIYFRHQDPGLGEYGWMVLLCFPVGAVIGFIGTWIYFFVRWLIRLP